ncbi:hypothetical protein [Amycolatopsis nalaikhensis]|uniref:Uncharacterized protein n=1 Tax=Amycolatopsis nalaikhensis TaxID=715472 RepID=A0ABY8XI41_9PSEU|nr:hypothetical protein [Amycolatopsis sp. 2-2]WIV55283.1 hypothetical protein QP939_41710 [Amycolatopsis sp. 2-2]
MAAGAAQAEGVPGVEDVDLRGGQDGGARAAGAAGPDADAEVVGGSAAAREAPSPADAEAVRDFLGGLYREQCAREDEVGAIGVELRLGVRRQGGEVDARGAEAGDPARGAVHFGQPFDHPQELGGREGIAAEALRGGGPVEPGTPE